MPPKVDKQQRAAAPAPASVSLPAEAAPGEPLEAGAVSVVTEPPAHDDELPVREVEEIDYVCGLRKVGPSRYSLVTGRVVDGIPDLHIDPVSQSQDHAAEELREAFRKLMVTIP